LIEIPEGGNHNPSTARIFLILLGEKAMRRAARISDKADCHGLPVSNATIPWGRNVIISGVPAARYLDRCDCGGFVVTGDPTVLISGLPAVRIQDKTSHGGMIIDGDYQTLLGDGVFEDQEINDIVVRLEDARENARQRSLEADLERQAYELAVEQHRQVSLRSPTEGPGGLPQSPNGQHGERLGYGAQRILQCRRMEEAEREEQAALNEVQEIEQELISETQRRLNQRFGTEL
jgi:uncharacterized Zn-binding protein involved in type VI secretion